MFIFRLENIVGISSQVWKDTMKSELCSYLESLISTLSEKYTQHQATMNGKQYYSLLCAVKNINIITNNGSMLIIANELYVDINAVILPVLTTCFSFNMLRLR